MRLLVHGKTLGGVFRCAVVLVTLACLPAAYGQEFSQGPLNQEFLRGRPWNGLYAFQDVYCLRFPDAGGVSATTEGLLANDGISYFRAVYEEEQIEAFVVSSMVPKDRTAADEFDRLLRNEKDNAARVNASTGRDRYQVNSRIGSLQPLIAVSIAGIDEYDGGTGRFPIARPLLANDTAPPYPHSAHRIFVRDGNRFEVAVLGIAPKPDAPEAAAQLERRLDLLADRITKSVQRCRSLPADYSPFAADPATRALPIDQYPDPSAP
ncbi:hypothetical protein [Lysobacter tyrosinilyticus]